MGVFQTKEVITDADERLFIEMAPKLYRDIPEYIRPLDKDILDVFNKEKNKAFRNGEVKRWLLFSGNEIVGRIAAFVNKKYRNKGDDGSVGGVGFFECINDQQAANVLFDTAKAWLQEKGVQAMDGPINFGERDRWWGLVVEGFHSPLYCMNYNPPYYQQLLESYGFQPFFYQICFAMKPKDPLNEKIYQRHKTFENDKNIKSETLKKSQLEKYAADFATVYNKAWAGHGGLKELAAKQAIAMFKSMKPVMDERIIFYAYYKNEPVAIFTNLPDLNQWFKHLNGKFGLMDKLKFLWIKATKKNTKFTGLVFGVVPEWQGKGMDAYIIGEAHKFVGSEASPYIDYEMQWIGDFNPKMLNVAQTLGDSYISRRLCTYRYNFDRTKEFKRHPMV